MEDRVFAPEMMAGLAHGREADIWGLGRAAVQVLHFSCCLSKDSALRQLIEAMLLEDPSARPTIKEVIKALNLLP